MTSARALSYARRMVKLARRMVKLAAIVLFVASLAGCPTRYTTPNDIGIEYWLGPPCRLVARDGVRVLVDVTGPRACKVTTIKDGAP